MKPFTEALLTMFWTVFLVASAAIVATWLTGCGRVDSHHIVQGVPGPAGRDGLDGKDGANGRDGRDGLDGHDGTNGRDGIDGRDGEDGQDAVIETVSLCPSIAGAYPEYLLRISQGLFAVYYDHSSKRAFLARLIPGNYVTTDGRSCYFTVTSDYQIVY